MTPQIYAHASPSSAITALRSPQRLPKSLALLRVLQSPVRNHAEGVVFANFPEFSGDSTAVPEDYVLVAHVEVFPGDPNAKWHALAGQVHLYSSLDDHDGNVPQDVEEKARSMLRVFLKKMCEVSFPRDGGAKEGVVSEEEEDFVTKQGRFGLEGNSSTTTTSEKKDKEEVKEERVGILFGSLHIRSVAILRDEFEVVQWHNVWRKYIFTPKRADEIVVPPLPPNLHLRNVKYDDLPYVLSKTSIPRTADQLSRLNNVGIYNEQEKLIVWCFESIDGSFISLFVDEGYRGKGLAKVVALELRRRSAEKGGSGDDGEGRMWAHADVGEDNVSSRGVMESIGGKSSWEISWLGVDLEGARVLE